MLALFSSVYTEMGLYRQALPLGERSLALREKLFGAEHGDVAESLYIPGRMKRLIEARAHGGRIRWRSGAPPAGAEMRDQENVRGLRPASEEPLPSKVTLSPAKAVWAGPAAATGPELIVVTLTVSGAEFIRWPRLVMLSTVAVLSDRSKMGFRMRRVARWR